MDIAKFFGCKKRELTSNSSVDNVRNNMKKV